MPRRIIGITTSILLILCALVLTSTPLRAVEPCTSPTFDVAPVFGVGIKPQTIASGDFNQNGHDDLVVANFGSGTGAMDGSLSVLLSNGAGGFETANAIPVGRNPRSVITADFTADGKTDIAVLTYATCCIESQ